MTAKGETFGHGGIEKYIESLTCFERGAYTPAMSRGESNAFHRLADRCLGMTETLLKNHRYRLAGSPECQAAAQDIARLFRECCDTTVTEPFTLHPKALWYVGKAVAAVYLLAAILGMIGGVCLYLASFLCFLGILYGILQYVTYSTLLDPLFKRGEGINVSASLEPVGKAEQQILLVAHHDSPFIFSFLERCQEIAYIRFLLGIGAFLYLSVSVIADSLRQIVSGGRFPLNGITLWLVVIGAPPAFQLFFMMSRRPSPGAGDNLNSASLAAVVAGYFRAEREKGDPLKRTRLIILSTDGEEIGQRGSIAYAKSHNKDLRSLPSRIINIDSIYFAKDLRILTQDRNFLCKLSGAMASDLKNIAFEGEIPIKKMPLPFGGGGTDAAAFAVAGFDTTSIIGMPTGLISNKHFYHTSKDTVDRIEPAAVAEVIELVVASIRKIDARKSLSA